MIVGAIAFFIYASVASRLMMRQKWAALPVTALALVVWLGVALGSGMACLISCREDPVQSWRPWGARNGTNTPSALPLAAP